MPQKKQPPEVLPQSHESSDVTSEPKSIQLESSLEDLFPDLSQIFFPYTVENASSSNVIVAIDTNALLLPYNIRKDDLSALAQVYKRLADDGRLFIPSRVAREFIRLREYKLAELLRGLTDKCSRISAADGKLSPLLQD